MTAGDLTIRTPPSSSFLIPGRESLFTGRVGGEEQKRQPEPEQGLSTWLEASVSMWL